VHPGGHGTGNGKVVKGPSKNFSISSIIYDKDPTVPTRRFRGVDGTSKIYVCIWNPLSFVRSNFILNNYMYVCPTTSLSLDLDLQIIHGIVG